MMRGVYQSRWTALIWFCLAIGSLAAADLQIQLKNDDRFSGVFLGESEGRLRLQHPLLGVLNIPTNEIAARVAPVAAAATNSATTSGVVATKPPSPPPPAKPPVTPAPRHWTFDLQAGMDLGFGATDRQLYNTRARALYSKNRLRNTADYMFTFGEVDRKASANRMDALMKTDYEIGSQMFLYDLGGAGYDAIRKLDLRYEVGPGLGYHAVRLEKFKLNVEAGANYQVQQFSDGKESDSFFYRIAEDAAWKITTKLSVDQKLEFFPGITDMEKFRVRFEGNLHYTLRGNLYLNLTALNTYDNQPASTVSKNDLQLRSSVGLKF